MNTLEKVGLLMFILSVPGFHFGIQTEDQVLTVVSVLLILVSLLVFLLSGKERTP